jgi:hypothetical protein
MNTAQQNLVRKHQYLKSQVRAMQATDARAATGLGRLAYEGGRYVSDFGRQALLLAGLVMLVGILLAATTGNTAFAEFLAWTGWFSN